MLVFGWASEAITNAPKSGPMLAAALPNSTSNFPGLTYHRLDSFTICCVASVVRPPPGRNRASIVAEFNRPVKNALLESSLQLVGLPPGLGGRSLEKK